MLQQVCWPAAPLGSHAGMPRMPHPTAASSTGTEGPWYPAAWACPHALGPRSCLAAVGASCMERQAVLKGAIGHSHLYACIPLPSAPVVICTHGLAQVALPMHTYTHSPTCACIHPCVLTCLCVCSPVCAHTCAYIHTCTSRAWTHSPTCVFTCMCGHSHWCLCSPAWGCAPPCALTCMWMHSPMCVHVFTCVH